MKIVCDSCGTKYSIADEKVRGKVFKIRCKKCSHIIVVRGGESAPEEATAAPAEGGWHLVIDGEQVGPIADADVRTKIERGEVKGDTYTWKEGFADWVKLSAVPEFAGLVAEDEDAACPWRAESSSRPAPLPRPLRPPTAPIGASRLGRAAFALRRGPRRGPATCSAPRRRPPHAAAAAICSARAGGPRAGRVALALFGRGGAGSRRRSGREPDRPAPRELGAVLALEPAVAGDARAAKPARRRRPARRPTEGSGLIDIRAMAASTLGGGAGGRSELWRRRLAAPSPTICRPSARSRRRRRCSLPLSSSSGPPKWIYPLIIVIGGAGRRHRAHGLQGPERQAARAGREVRQVPAPAPGAGEAGRAGGASRAAQADDHRRRESAAARRERRGQGGREVGKVGEAASTSITTAKGKESGKKVAGGDDKKGAAARWRQQRARREEARQGIARRFDRRRASAPAHGWRAAARLATTTRAPGRPPPRGAAVEERGRRRHELGQAQGRRLLQPVQGARAWRW